MALGTIREAYERVVKEEAGGLGNVQDILRKKARTSCCGSLRRLHCNCFSLDDYIWWCRRDTETAATEKAEALQLVVRGLWRPIRMESAKQDTGGFEGSECVPSLPRLLANQQKDDEREMQGMCYERIEKLHRIGRLLCSGGGPPALRPAALQSREAENEWRQFGSSKRRSG